MEVLLRITLLCIVSNNSYTKVGNIGDITKYFLVYFFYINLIIKVLISTVVLLLIPTCHKIAGNRVSRLFFCPGLAFSVFFWRLLNG